MSSQHNTPERGVLFVVSGPSGVGKSTLVRRVMEKFPDLSFSVSATTRAPRKGEQDGVHYHYLDLEQFQEGLRGGLFLEHAEVYGRYYGTLLKPTEDALAEGRSLILDIDLVGSRQIRESFPEAVHIFILPPDRTTLERRLRKRATDSEDVIRRRLEEMDSQLSGCGEYDYVFVNDALDTAVATLKGIIRAEKARVSRCPNLVAQWSLGVDGNEQVDIHP